MADPRRRSPGAAEVIGSPPTFAASRRAHRDGGTGVAEAQRLPVKVEVADVAIAGPRLCRDLEIRRQQFGVVPLCGHATLASAHVLMTILQPGRAVVRFHSKSGPLTVIKAGELYTLDFPALDIVDDVACDYDAVAEALGAKPVFGKLKATPKGACMVTAPGVDCDFVSRCFAPVAGVDEDPVTGSSHSTLIPFWAAKLGKKTLLARRLSARGGTLHCEDRGDRVSFAGKARLYLSGTIRVPV